MVKPTVCQLRRDSNRVVHLVRADEAKPLSSRPSN
jgi:hypothetical protein